MIRDKKIITGLVLLSILWISSGCAREEKKSRVNEVVPVKVVKLERKNLQETIDYVGNIKAQEEAVVYPKVSGKIIEKIKEDGDAVEKGETIAYIDRDEVGFKFEKAPVESPLTGIVGRIYVDIGENVNTQIPIALVVDMNRVEIDLDVPEKYYARVALGQVAKIRVDTYPQEEFEGKVSKISPVVDLSTRSAPIEILVDNPENKLRSGMFAKVDLIVAEHKNVPVILKEAVMGKEPNLYVYVIDNNKAVSKNISLGVHKGQDYQVTEGLKEGDIVVIMGQQKLYEGAQVRVEGEK